jgi:hypothetical protein
MKKVINHKHRDKNHYKISFLKTNIYRIYRNHNNRIQEVIRQRLDKENKNLVIITKDFL